MQSELLIEARDLTKRYADLTAVDGIDFEVTRGECLGFLGPNGAGKTSTIRMICCVSPVTSGSLRVFGLDPEDDAREIKGRLGVVPQNDNLDSDLTVIENLIAYARYFDIEAGEGRARARSVLELMSLDGKAGERIDNLSGGMKRRLIIARALVSQPELLILDEPTTGLDPQARHLVWQRLRQLKREGTTILLTTHYLEEAAQLCDRVMIIDEARVVARGTPNELIQIHVGAHVLEVHLDVLDRERGLAALKGSLNGLEMEETEDVVYFFAREEGVSQELAGSIAHSAVRDVIHRAGNLEDVFLRLTGRGLVE